MCRTTPYKNLFGFFMEIRHGDSSGQYTIIWVFGSEVGGGFSG
jgi:hypothetical protein